MIKIIGSEHRCETPYISAAQEYTTFLSPLITKGLEYRECWFEDKKEMFLNTHNTKSLLLYVEEDTQITFKIFPVNPSKYKFNKHIFWDYYESIPFAFIDPILDYYDIDIRFQDNKIQKKYKKYSYTLQDMLNITV